MKHAKTTLNDGINKFEKRRNINEMDTKHHSLSLGILAGAVNTCTWKGIYMYVVYRAFVQSTICFFENLWIYNMCQNFQTHDKQYGSQNDNLPSLVWL